MIHSPTIDIIRLGFAVRILGQAGLRSHDGRRAAQVPHLSVSLIHLRDVIAYLAQHDITFYRLSDSLAPYLTSTHHLGFERQLEECSEELAAVGALVNEYGVRLTLHAGLHIALAAPDAAEGLRAAAALVAQAALLDSMGLSEDSVIVLHVGGAYDDPRATLDRFARRYTLLPPATRRRIVVEHDDRVWSLSALLPLHQACGVPIVFDYLHHMVLNPTGLPLEIAMALAIATWPSTMRPKIHFSSPRTEAHLGPRGAGTAVLPPRSGQHADYLNPFEYATMIRAAHGLPPFDVMLEAKAGDLALLRLRADLVRYAPQLAERVH